MVMNETELRAAASAICLRLSKVSGCLLLTNKEEATRFFDALGQFLVRNKRFRLLTNPEVALAASWNAAGEWEKVKHWQQEINLDYIGELLNQYCRYKAKFGIREKLESATDHLLPSNTQRDPFFWEKQIEEEYQKFLKGKYNLLLWLPGMFDKLVDLGLLRPYDFTFHLEHAYYMVREEILQEIAELKSQGKALHAINAKATHVYEYKHSNPYVLPVAKRLAVRTYFEYCNSVKMKNLFVEEKI